MKRVEAPTYVVSIYVAGDLDTARAICRAHCMSGLCVTIEPVEYIYTGGSETGVRVGLINYPRFPAEPDAIFTTAKILAEALMIGLCQQSYSIVTPGTTLWYSRRPEGA